MNTQGAGPDADLYRLLGVASTVDGPELARAYRRRLRQLHPDTCAQRGGDAERGGDGRGGDVDPVARRALELAAVQHAYQVLRDPTGRARYDAAQRSGATAARLGGPARPPVSITVRVRAAARGEFLVRVGPVRVDPLPPPAR